MVVQAAHLEKLGQTLDLSDPVAYFKQFLDLKEKANTRYKGGLANVAWKEGQELYMKRLKQAFGLPLVFRSRNPLALNAWKRWQTLLEMAILYNERDTHNSRGAGGILWSMTLPIPIAIHTEGIED